MKIWSNLDYLIRPAVQELVLFIHKPIKVNKVVNLCVLLRTGQDIYLQGQAKVSVTLGPIGENCFK